MLRGLAFYVQGFELGAKTLWGLWPCFFFFFFGGGGGFVSVSGFQGQVLWGFEGLPPLLERRSGLLHTEGLSSASGLVCRKKSPL